MQCAAVIMDENVLVLDDDPTNGTHVWRTYMLWGASASVSDQVVANDHKIRSIGPLRQWALQGTAVHRNRYRNGQFVQKVD